MSCAYVLIFNGGDVGALVPILRQVLTVTAFPFFFRDNTIEILIDTEEQSDCQKHVPIIVDGVQQIK